MEKYDEIFKIMRLFGKDARRADGMPYDFDLTDESVLRALLGARSRVTPAYITSLDEGEVFVFGSDERGTHYGRASLMARQLFGAVLGEGEGLFGRSYALPTTCDYKPLELDKLRAHVKKFLDMAKLEKGLIFMVTPVGCGYSGRDAKDVAPMFAEALAYENVYLPQSFLDVLFDEKFPYKNPSEMVPSVSSGMEGFRNDLWRQLSYYMMWVREHYTCENKRIRRDVIDGIEIISHGIIEAVELSFRGLPSSAYKALETVLDRHLLEREVKKRKADIKLEEIEDFYYHILGRSMGGSSGLTQAAVEEAYNTYAKKLDNSETVWVKNPMASSKDFLRCINPGPIFYRMRSEQDNMKKQKVDCKGMFHIGFSNRGIVKTQRYSVPGYPCLYMGERIYGCWVELGKPNLNDCLISKLRNVKPFYVMDLSIPKPEAWEEPDSPKLRKTLLTFPLIIACTFKQHDTKAVFKPEYIVPQLLLQYVKELAFEHNKAVATKDEKVVFGIQYTSVHTPKAGEKTDLEERLKGENLFSNYVVPVVDIKNELCSKLTDIFKISEPICEEFEMAHYKNGKDVFDTLEDILLATIPQTKPEEDRIPCKDIR